MAPYGKSLAEEMRLMDTPARLRAYPSVVSCHSCGYPWGEHLTGVVANRTKQIPRGPAAANEASTYTRIGQNEAHQHRQPEQTSAIPTK